MLVLSNNQKNIYNIYADCFWDGQISRWVGLAVWGTPMMPGLTSLCRSFCSHFASLFNCFVSFCFVCLWLFWVFCCFVSLCTHFASLCGKFTSLQICFLSSNDCFPSFHDKFVHLCGHFTSYFAFFVVILQPVLVVLHVSLHGRYVSSHEHVPGFLCGQRNTFWSLCCQFACLFCLSLWLFLHHFWSFCVSS